ncbi:MAG TPA: hypothetical protein IAB53_09030 [Candidatus Scybalocola faecipullorum]|nr:hypothetical protein [Candidatus Scybalocola faecipullorum]
MRLLWLTAFYNFRQWRRSPRIAVTFILAFILCFFLTDKIISFAGEQHTTMQIAEAFIWTFGDSHSILLSSLLLLILFADVPFITPATPFFLSRENKKIWVFGQMLYMIGATVIYMGFVLLSSCVLCMRMSYVNNIWSRTAAILAYSEAGEALNIPAAVNILEMSRPYTAMLCVFLLMLLYTLVLVVMMLFFNLWKGQIAGTAAVLIFSVFGFLLRPENIQTILKLPEELFYKARVWLGWLSPLNHATYAMHNFGYDRLPTFGQTVLIFLCLLTVFAVLSALVMKRYQFQFKGTQK